jgi:tRNA threonylcarbamoyladenosine biosynthesis protein TsaB
MQPRSAASDLQPARCATSTSESLLPTPGAASLARSARPRLLALAVHWDDCSVALGNGESIVSELWSGQPERASARAGAADAAAAGGSPIASRDALLLLDRLLAKSGASLSDIDRLCFARGPGAFTSLRVAAGLVQGLSLATSIPVTGICSLAALIAHEPGWRGGDGQGAWLQLAALDARMGECYFGVHLCLGGSHPTVVLAPAVGSPARAVAAFESALVHHPGTRPVLAGNGFRLLPELAGWAERTGHDPERAGARVPTAAAVLAVAASAGAPAPGPARSALPVYVRDKIALDVGEQLANATARALSEPKAGAARTAT